jgi:heat shock protein HslJ
VIQKRLVSTILAAVMLASLSAATAAQDEASGPEGFDWMLTSYLSDDGTDLTPVPFGVEATLLLDAGTASGSGGCNTFGGAYRIEGSSLAFDDELTRTLALCDEEIQAVEDVYLSTLLEVEAWAIDGDVLELSDDFGDTILTFEVPGATVTASQLAALLATLDALRADIDRTGQRVDSIGIRKLRDRLKALETDNARLRQQLAALSAPTRKATPAPSTGFTVGEKVLLEGIPTRIASRCSPLRDRLPDGAVAAVVCKPNTSLVTEMAYYLMEQKDALSLFNERMSFEGVPGIPDVAPPGTRSCADGRASYVFAGGGGVAGIGCYVADGKANVRVVQQSTACKQLRIGNKRVARPVTYVAMTGADDKIKRLYDWSMRNKPNNQVSGVFQTIPRPNAADSPNCFS